MQFQPPDRPDTSAESGDAMDAARLRQECLRVLRRLCETGTVLAVAAEMERAVVVRDGPDGASLRTAVVDREVAEALALKGWIASSAPGRIQRYHVTQAGRAALNRMLAEAENSAQGFREAPAAFTASRSRPPARGRTALSESPLAGLARRRDRDGSPFLSEDLVRAGERLREDFELSQVGPRVAQDWNRFLEGGARTGGDGGGGGAGRDAASAAQARVQAALAELGPGLGDMALRCCCYLEGLEKAERRMGWSARSGKIVLRIALQRLKRHYDEVLGDSGALIG